MLFFWYYRKSDRISIYQYQFLVLERNISRFRLNLILPYMKVSTYVPYLVYIYCLPLYGLYGFFVVFCSCFLQYRLKHQTSSVRESLSCIQVHSLNYKLIYVVVVSVDCCCWYNFTLHCFAVFPKQLPQVTLSFSPYRFYLDALERYNVVLVSVKLNIFNQVG